MLKKLLGIIAVLVVVVTSNAAVADGPSYDDTVRYIQSFVDPFAEIERCRFKANYHDSAGIFLFDPKFYLVNGSCSA
jgi:hypothetical protein